MRLIAGDILSDTVIVRVPLGSDGGPLHQKEGPGAHEAHQHHDEQLPVQEKVVAVEEGHRSGDGLQRRHEEKNTTSHTTPYTITNSIKVGF